MKESRASRSAAIVAAHRAAESSRGPGVRVCDDPYAHQFLPPGFTVIGPHSMPGDQALERFKERVPGFHEFFVARTRYMDDCLAQAISTGVEQVVILGAGFDSRAYRFQALTSGIRVFEVDHPATQAVKIKKLTEIFRCLPDHVRFVPADFSDRDLEARLRDRGYDSGLDTFFICEGVSMYLRPEQADRVLGVISANTGTNTWVVFDHTYPDVLSGRCQRKEAREWLKIARGSDEPLWFAVDPDRMALFLEERGFSSMVSLSGADLNRLYFTGENRGRKATPIFSIVLARAAAPAKR